MGLLKEQIFDKSDLCDKLIMHKTFLHFVYPYFQVMKGLKCWASHSLPPGENQFIEEVVALKEKPFVYAVWLYLYFISFGLYVRFDAI